PLALGVLAWAAAALASLPIYRYYQRTFGRVQAAPVAVTHAWLSAFSVLVAMIVWFGIGIALQLPDAAGPLGVGVIFAGATLADVWRAGGLRPFGLVVAVAFVGDGLLLLLGPLPDGSVWATTGLAFILGGLLDHLLLVRTLPPAGTTEDVDVGAV